MSRSKKHKRFAEIEGLVAYTPEDDDVTLAHVRSSKLGSVPNAVGGYTARMAGFLGEVAVCNYLGKKCEYVGDTEYDHDALYKKHKIEIKSKSCGRRPDPHFNAFVNGPPELSPDNDVYFFTRVRSDLRRVYLCGWLPTPTLFDEAEYKPVGVMDNYGFVTSMEGFHIEISELHHPKTLKIIRKG